jgi:hypothetical protein
MSTHELIHGQSVHERVRAGMMAIDVGWCVEKRGGLHISGNTGILSSLPHCPAHQSTQPERRVKWQSPNPLPSSGSVTSPLPCGDFFNTVLSKSYKDGEDWKDTDQLGTGDLLNAAKLLQRAEQFISEQ